MYKKIFIFIFALIAILSMFFWCLFLLSKTEIDKEIVILTPGQAEAYEIYDGLNIEQSFVGDYDFLKAIVLRVDSHFTVQDYWLEVSLFNNNKTIFNERTLLGEMSTFTKYEFDIINDSDKNNFTLNIKTSAPIDDPALIYVTNVKEDGSLFLNGEKSDKSLFFFRIYGNPNSKNLGWSSFNLIIDRISQYKPDIFKGLALYKLIVVYIALIIIFMFSFIKKML